MKSMNTDHRWSLFLNGRMPHAGGMPPHPSPSAAPVDTLADKAIELARRWVTESAGVEVDASAARLAGVLKDPNGLPFTIGFVDGVMRPESLSAAASNLSRVAPLVPKFLPWYLRGAVQLGGAVAPVLPSPVVPIARRVLREMVGHLVVDARPDKLGPAIAKIREGGAKLNLNLLGEAVLGEQEALRRLDGIHELIRRSDVDYVSVKVSAIASHISMWAFDEVVDKVVERLMPLYLTAATDGTFINLDMEEYRDLDLTIAVFTRILEDPRLQRLEAGIVLQAYLPDAQPALEQLTAWAQQRVAAGGARIKVRLVKGANLAMERVDAVMHDWSLATYDSKLDSDANYLRCLRVRAAARAHRRGAGRRRRPQPVRHRVRVAARGRRAVCATPSSSRCCWAWRRARSRRSRVRSGTCFSTCRSCAPTSSTSRSATWCAGSRRTRRARTSCRRPSSSPTNPAHVRAGARSLRRLDHARARPGAAHRTRTAGRTAPRPVETGPRGPLTRDSRCEARGTDAASDAADGASTRSVPTA